MRLVLSPVKVFRTSVFISLLLTSFLICENPVRSQQRACIISDKGETVCGKLVKQTRSPASQPIQSFGQRDVVGNFVYVLRVCKRFETNVKCVFTVSTKGKETNKQAYASAFELVGSNGQSYKGSMVEFGGQQGPFATATMSPGVDYAAQITFEGIPTQMTRFQILRGEFNEFGQNQVHFRNIVISN
jgi:hypothetical protein